MLHFCRIYAYWPDKQGKSAWEKLDAHGPHALCTTRHATCIGLGLTSQATCPARIPWWRMRLWMTERLKACGWVTTSAPPCSECTRSSCEKWYVSVIPAISTTFCLSYVRRISLTALTSLLMTSARCTRVGDTVQRMPRRKSTRFRIAASGEPVLVTPDSDALDADSGENSDFVSVRTIKGRSIGELDTGEPDTAEQDKESPSTAQHKVLLGPKDYKRLKHGKDAPFDAELQYLKPQLLAQALALFYFKSVGIINS